MKTEWRKVLNSFRKTKVGRKETSIPKDLFPGLLKDLDTALHKNGKGKQSLVNGFRKCGIVPCAVQPLLDSLPKARSTPEEDAQAMDESLLSILTEMREDGPSRAKKSKKLNIVPGQSVTEEDLTVTQDAVPSVVRPGRGRGGAARGGGRYQARMTAGLRIVFSRS